MEKRMSLPFYFLNHVEKVYLCGWIFALVGAVITLISVSLLMWSTRIKDHRFEKEIAQLNIDAAKANERAAEANLELAKLKAPRTVSPEQQSRIIEKLKGFPGTTFEVITYPGEPEPVAFSNVIAGLLERAGWRLNPNNSKGSLLGLASGVVVVIGKQAGASAEEKGKTLLEALVSEGISARLGYDSLQVNPVAIEIAIRVAKKP